jgi:hypothetical protein
MAHQKVPNDARYKHAPVNTCVGLTLVVAMMAAMWSKAKALPQTRISLIPLFSPAGREKKRRMPQPKLVKHASSNPAEASGHPNIWRRPGDRTPFPLILDPGILEQCYVERAWSF